MTQSPLLQSQNAPQDVRSFVNGGNVQQATHYDQCSSTETVHFHMTNVKICIKAGQIAMKIPD